MPSAKATRARPKARSSRRQPARRKLPIVPIVIGVVILLAVAAAVATSGGGGDRDTEEGIEQVRPVVVAGEPLAPHTGSGGDPAVGAPAPEIEGARFDGTPLTIGADGRAKVLVFLAHWCPHCQREVSTLAAWLAENGMPEDVDIYGIATATTPERPNYPPSEWLDQERFAVPTLADDTEGSTARAFGLSGFPFFVAVDEDNLVVARASGELRIEQWEQLIDQLGSRTGSPS